MCTWSTGLQKENLSRKTIPSSIETPAKEQFYSDECLYEALSGFFYVHEVKNILKAVKEEGNNDEVKKKYVEPLKKLKALAPNQSKSNFKSS